MKVFSVGEVTRYIKQLFDRDGNLNGVFVRGEISNFKRHYSGHCYFTLKDNEAMIKAVLFRSKGQYIKFEPKDGLKVVAGGYITVFERDGQYQLYVEHLIPEGVGELSLAFQQIKTKLAAEGLFDEARKRPLPFLPRAVGIITSPAGAALRDIVTVARRRHPGIALVLHPVQVQGEDAPSQICRAIAVLGNFPEIEVIIVGRGGGSIEELWAFNDERVVRAIASSPTPVISAVGHQTDYTLADFAADCRAATPSQAAELVVPDIKELWRYVGSLESRLFTGIGNIVKQRRKRLEQCMESMVFKRPKSMLVARQQLVDARYQRLVHAMKQFAAGKRHAFTVAAEKLDVLSPLAVLSRGYSITQGMDGRVICKSSDVKPGEGLEILLRYGSIDVEVVKTKEAKS